MDNQLSDHLKIWRSRNLFFESKKKWRGEKVMVEWRELHTIVTQETRVSIMVSLSKTSYFLNKISAYTTTFSKAYPCNFCAIT